MDRIRVEVIKGKGKKKVYQDERATYQLVNGMRLVVDEKRIREL